MSRPYEPREFDPNRLEFDPNRVGQSMDAATAQMGAISGRSFLGRGTIGEQPAYGNEVEKESPVQAALLDCSREILMLCEVIDMLRVRLDKGGALGAPDPQVERHIHADPPAGPALSDRVRSLAAGVAIARGMIRTIERRLEL